MTDTNKRRTLKRFGATSLAALPFASIAGMVDSAILHSEKSPLTVSGIVDLEIQIIDTGSVANNSLLFHNAGQGKIVINQFLVGAVIFNSRMLELNALFAKGPIVIEPWQTRSFVTDIWNVLAVPSIEHTYADHVVEILNADTSAVRLGAYLFNDKAVVYPDLAKTIHS